jgi:hypothetical protein
MCPRPVPAPPSERNKPSTGRSAWNGAALRQPRPPWNLRNKRHSGSVSPTENVVRAAWRKLGPRRGNLMNRPAFIAAAVFPLTLFLVSLPAPAPAQSATSIGASPFAAQTPTTGVFCTQEMTATFCNVVTRPNISGYGRNGSGSTTAAGTAGAAGLSGAAGAAGGNNSSIPPCPAHPPFNELCD